jgi:hypothetical protein
VNFCLTKYEICCLFLQKLRCWIVGLIMVWDIGVRLLDFLQKWKDFVCICDDSGILPEGEPPAHVYMLLTP